MNFKSIRVYANNYQSIGSKCDEFSEGFYAMNECDGDINTYDVYVSRIIMQKCSIKPGFKRYTHSLGEVDIFYFKSPKPDSKTFCSHEKDPEFKIAAFVLSHLSLHACKRR